MNENERLLTKCILFAGLEPKNMAEMTAKIKAKNKNKKG